MESNKTNKYGVPTTDALAQIIDFLENETGSPTTEESVIMICNKDVSRDITVLTAKCSTTEDIDGLWSIHKESYKPSPDSATERNWSDAAFEQIADGLKRTSEAMVDSLANIDWVDQIVFDDDEDE